MFLGEVADFGTSVNKVIEFSFLVHRSFFLLIELLMFCLSNKQGTIQKFNLHKQPRKDDHHPIGPLPDHLPTLNDQPDNTRHLAQNEWLHAASAVRCSFFQSFPSTDNNSLFTESVNLQDDLICVLRYHKVLYRNSICKKQT